MYLIIIVIMFSVDKQRKGRTIKSDRFVRNPRHRLRSQRTQRNSRVGAIVIAPVVFEFNDGYV